MMDNNFNKQGAAAISAANAPTEPLEQGKWEAVDSSSLGFQVRGEAGQVFQGPDGAMYKIVNSEPQYNSVAANGNYAIPTPPSMVQLPPIVQPIALVPYTSQNQPLLQYDPYSRPVDPPAQPKAPTYVRKPYRGISLICFILALISSVLLLVGTVAKFGDLNGMRFAFDASGLDFIVVILAIFGVKTESSYFDAKLQTAKDMFAKDAVGTIVAYALPFIVAVIFILTVCITIKYLVRLVRKKSPRGFSALTIVNLVLVIAAIGILLGLTNGETPIADRSKNIGDFFLLKSSVAAGYALIVCLAVTIALLIIPAFAKKNAYMLEKDDPSYKTHIIND